MPTAILYVTECTILFLFYFLLHFQKSKWTVKQNTFKFDLTQHLEPDAEMAFFNFLFHVIFCLTVETDNFDLVWYLSNMLQCRKEMLNWNWKKKKTELSIQWNLEFSRKRSSLGIQLYRPPALSAFFFNDLLICKVSWDPFCSFRYLFGY